MYPALTRTTVVAFLAFCTVLSSHAKNGGEIIVQFKADATDSDIIDVVNHGRLKPKRHLLTAPMAERNHSGLTLADSEGSVEETLQQLRKHRAVEFAEENVHYTHQATSNDPCFTAGNMWGVYGNLSAPANNYGSQAAEAWQAGYTGSKSVYVGVIDEGIQVNHPDLAANMWSNPFDPPDGIDNDGNGYVDDVNGWNFLANNNQVFDAANDDHGTHVAGTIGAVGGNAAGVAGVNWNVTIISGKFMGTSGGSTLDAVEAIDYFIDLKKRHSLNLVALSASWGGSGYSQALHSAIIRAAKAGILFVAAAGNSGLNNDTTANYPSNIDTTVATATEAAASFNAVLAVAAIDSNGALASFSNYGASKVHLGAPGVQILSTYPTSSYGYMSGTSMATPHVTGAVALYASTHPGASAQAIRTAILGAVAPTPSLAGKTSTGGRLDLSTIITPATTVVQPPAAPAGLSAVAGIGKVTLSWAAVANATSYNVKRATVSGGPYTTLSNLATPGYTDTAVTAGVTYYYLVAASNSGGSSANSAQVSATPLISAPSAPTGVTSSASLSTVAGNATVTVNWAAATGATSYVVDRAPSPSGPWAAVATGVTSTTYSQSVAAGGSYYYAMRASNSSGTSPDSAYIAVQPAAPVPANLTATANSSTQVQLRWTDRTSDEQGFKLEYSTSGTWYQLGTLPTGSTSIVVNGTSSRSTYSFRVRAYNGTVNTAYSNLATITMP